jgi:hypothetical protein
LNYKRETKNKSDKSHKRCKYKSEDSDSRQPEEKAKTLRNTTLFCIATKILKPQVLKWLRTQTLPILLDFSTVMTASRSPPTYPCFMQTKAKMSPKGRD